MKVISVNQYNVYQALDDGHITKEEARKLLIPILTRYRYDFAGRHAQHAYEKNLITKEDLDLLIFNSQYSRSERERKANKDGVRKNLGLDS